MNGQPRHTLRELIAEHGDALIDDPRRTEAFLKDLCPQDLREIFILVNAQRQRVPNELRAAPGWMPQAALWTRLADRLQEKLGLSEDAAAWAVESWAYALQMTPGPADRVWVWLAGVGRRKQPPSAAAPKQATASKQPTPANPERQFTENGVQLGGAATGTTSSAASTPRPASFGAPVQERAAGKRARSWSYGAQPRRAPQQQIRRSSPMVWAVGLVGGVLAGTMLAVWLTGVSLPSMLSAFALTPRPASFFGATQNPAPDHFPVPRSAWVTLAGAPVYETQDADASTTAQPIVQLSEAQHVTVNGFSPEMQWAQLASPNQGWISTKHLVLRTDGQPAITVRLNRRPMTVLANRLNVRAGPALTYEAVASVVRDEVVEAIATTTDGAWVQIIEPVTGWVSADYVTVVENDGQPATP